MCVNVRLSDEHRPPIPRCYSCGKVNIIVQIYLHFSSFCFATPGLYGYVIVFFMCLKLKIFSGTHSLIMSKHLSYLNTSIFFYLLFKIFFFPIVFTIGIKSGISVTGVILGSYSSNCLVLSTLTTLIRTV